MFDIDSMLFWTNLGRFSFSIVQSPSAVLVNAETFGLLLAAAANHVADAVLLQHVFVAIVEFATYISIKKV